MTGRQLLFELGLEEMSHDPRLTRVYGVVGCATAHGCFECFYKSYPSRATFTASPGPHKAVITCSVLERLHFFRLPKIYPHYPDIIAHDLCLRLSFF